MLGIGSKRDAAQYAASAGLWAHALVISSSVDQDLWREMVHRFAVAEIGGTTAAGMKAAYSLFSGATLASGEHLAVSHTQLMKSGRSCRCCKHHG